MAHHQRSPTFVTVTCPCGRTLRAKSDQAGTEVRCWDCRQMVLIPTRLRGKVAARDLSDGARVVIEGPGLKSLLKVAAIVTASLAIPRYGVWASAVVLALAASVYGEIIQRVSRGPEDDSDPDWLASIRPGSVFKLILCSLMAAGTVAPLWWFNAGLNRSPRWDRLGAAVATATWLLLPILMLMAYGRTEQDGPIGVGRSLKYLARHPIATLLTLAVVPMTLLLVEIGLGLLMYLPGDLSFFALDYMPMPTMPDKPVVYLGIPFYKLLDYRAYPAAIFRQGYFDGLSNGYSFVGAIPASLSLPTRAGLNGELIGMPEPLYLIARVLTVWVIVTCLLAAFGVQARWLGSIPALDRKRRT